MGVVRAAVNIISEVRHAYRIRKWLREGGLSKVDFSKLGSRKLWVTILLSVFVTVLHQMGLPENIINSIAQLGMAYLGAQGVVDIMKARNGG